MSDSRAHEEGGRPAPDEHGRLREALGAYTLGALDSAERSEVERHLADCPDCRDELAGFAVVPGLLGRLTVDEADLGLRRGDAVETERAVAGVAAERRAVRRRLWTWRAVAAVAVVVLALVLVPFPDRSPVTELPAAPVAADADAVEGVVRVFERDWGMTVELELANLPDRRGFALWALAGEDHRALAGSWAATDTGAIKLVGSCYLDLADVHRFEVVTPDDEVIVAFDTGLNQMGE